MKKGAKYKIVENILFLFLPQPLWTPLVFIPIQRSFLISYLFFFFKSKNVTSIIWDDQDLFFFFFLFFFYVRNMMTKTKCPFGNNLSSFLLKFFCWKCVKYYLYLKKKNWKSEKKWGKNEILKFIHKI